jgi:hypothetical protein
MRKYFITLLWVVTAGFVSAVASGMIVFALALFNLEALRALWSGVGQWVLVAVAIAAAVTLSVRGRLPGT